MSIAIVFKTIWVFNSFFRPFIFRICPGIFFGSIGRKVRMFGFPNFGTFNGNIFIGNDCMIGRHVFFSASKSSRIIIGDHCSLNTGCHLVSIYGIEIGSGTRIGEYCSIRDQNHRFDKLDVSVSEQGYTGSRIVIGTNCWIGRGVFIAPGVNIGNNSVIGANSVVTKDVPENSVFAGVPARFLRPRGITDIFQAIGK